MGAAVNMKEFIMPKFRIFPLCLLGLCIAGGALAEPVRYLVDLEVSHEGKVLAAPKLLVTEKVQAGVQLGHELELRFTLSTQGQQLNWQGQVLLQGEAEARNFRMREGMGKPVAVVVSSKQGDFRLRFTPRLATADSR